VCFLNKNKKPKEICFPLRPSLSKRPDFFSRWCFVVSVDLKKVKFMDLKK
jgi:hypothetical protein